MKICGFYQLNGRKGEEIKGGKKICILAQFPGLLLKQSIAYYENLEYGRSQRISGNMHSSEY